LSLLDRPIAILQEGGLILYWPAWRAKAAAARLTYEKGMADQDHGNDR
jgi:hypothetical protein